MNAQEMWKRFLLILMLGVQILLIVELAINSIVSQMSEMRTESILRQKQKKTTTKNYFQIVKNMNKMKRIKPIIETIILSLKHIIDNLNRRLKKRRII